jgi:hypothetical protein
MSRVHDVSTFAHAIRRWLREAVALVDGMAGGAGVLPRAWQLLQRMRLYARLAGEHEESARDQADAHITVRMGQQALGLAVKAGEALHELRALAEGGRCEGGREPAPGGSAWLRGPRLTPVGGTE